MIYLYCLFPVNQNVSEGVVLQGRPEISLLVTADGHDQPQPEQSPHRCDLPSPSARLTNPSHGTEQTAGSGLTLSWFRDDFSPG